MNSFSEYDEEYPLQGLTLLLADDEVRLRQIVVLMAEELGATVIAVDTSEKAIEMYKARQSDIDILLLDLRMVGMSGEKAYEEIKQFDPSAKIVLSSGILPDDNLIRKLKENGDDFIEKPFDMDMLGSALAKVAHGSPQCASI